MLNHTQDAMCTPTSIQAAAATIQAYAHANKLTPQNVVDMFNVGIFAYTLAGIVPKGAEPLAIIAMDVPPGADAAAPSTGSTVHETLVLILRELRRLHELQNAVVGGGVTLRVGTE